MKAYIAAAALLLCIGVEAKATYVELFPAEDVIVCESREVLEKTIKDATAYGPGQLAALDTLRRIADGKVDGCSVSFLFLINTSEMKTIEIRVGNVPYVITATKRIEDNAEVFLIPRSVINSTYWRHQPI